MGPCPGRVPQLAVTSAAHSEVIPPPPRVQHNAWRLWVRRTQQHAEKTAQPGVKNGWKPVCWLCCFVPAGNFRRGSRYSHCFSLHIYHQRTLTLTFSFRLCLFFLPHLSWKAFWYLVTISCNSLSLTIRRWELEGYLSRQSSGLSLLNVHIFPENGVRVESKTCCNIIKEQFSKQK